MASSKRPRVGDVEQKLKTFMGPDGGLLAEHAAAFCKLMATQGSEVSSCASLDATKGRCLPRGEVGGLSRNGVSVGVRGDILCLDADPGPATGAPSRFVAWV
jgi:hypothetical protein